MLEMALHCYLFSTFSYTLEEEKYENNIFTVYHHLKKSFSLISLRNILFEDD